MTPGGPGRLDPPVRTFPGRSRPPCRSSAPSQPCCALHDLDRGRVVCAGCAAAAGDALAAGRRTRASPGPPAASWRLQNVSDASLTPLSRSIGHFDIGETFPSMPGDVGGVEKVRELPTWLAVPSGASSPSLSDYLTNLLSVPTPISLSDNHPSLEPPRRDRRRVA